MAVKEIACARSIAAHRSERHAAIFHNRAAFLGYQRWRSLGERFMRLIFGMIIGAALTVGGAYIADPMAGREAKSFVNCGVVAENSDTVNELACDCLKRM